MLNLHSAIDFNTNFKKKFFYFTQKNNAIQIEKIIFSNYY
jgi:hypothetical protein